MRNPDLSRVMSLIQHYDSVNFWSGFLIGVMMGALLTAIFLMEVSA